MSRYVIENAYNTSFLYFIKKENGVYTAANAINAGDEAYWTDEVGYAKKNQWLELKRAEADDEGYEFSKADGSTKYAFKVVDAE